MAGHVVAPDDRGSWGGRRNAQKSTNASLRVLNQNKMPQVRLPCKSVLHDFSLFPDLARSGGLVDKWHGRHSPMFHFALSN